MSALPDSRPFRRQVNLGWTQYPLRNFRLQQQVKDTGLERKLTAPDEQLADLVDRERPRLRNFIRRRVPDPRDADILQDVFSALVEAVHAGAARADRTKHLTTEDRERFRERMRERYCGVTGQRPPETSPTNTR